MERSEFARVFAQYEDNRITNEIERNGELSSIWLHYRNNDGVENKFEIINVEYSIDYPGCIEGDCYSEYQAGLLDEYYGIDEPDCAISSHRTFSIRNIIEARA